MGSITPLNKINFLIDLNTHTYKLQNLSSTKQQIVKLLGDKAQVNIFMDESGQEYVELSEVGKQVLHDLQVHYNGM